MKMNKKLLLFFLYCSPLLPCCVCKEEQYTDKELNQLKQKAKFKETLLTCLKTLKKFTHSKELCYKEENISNKNITSILYAIKNLPRNSSNLISSDFFSLVDTNKLHNDDLLYEEDRILDDLLDENRSYSVKFDHWAMLTPICKFIFSKKSFRMNEFAVLCAIMNKIQDTNLNTKIISDLKKRNNEKRIDFDDYSDIFFSPEFTEVNLKLEKIQGTDTYLLQLYDTSDKYKILKMSIIDLEQIKELLKDAFKQEKEINYVFLDQFLKKLVCVEHSDDIINFILSIIYDNDIKNKNINFLWKFLSYCIASEKLNVDLLLNFLLKKIEIDNDENEVYSILSKKLNLELEYFYQLFQKVSNMMEKYKDINAPSSLSKLFEQCVKAQALDEKEEKKIFSKYPHTYLI